MPLRDLAMALAMLPAAAAQDSPKGDPGTLLVRQQFVPLRTLRADGDLGLTGFVRESSCVVGDTWLLPGLTIDAASREVLDVSPERVRLRAGGKREMWSVDRGAAHVDAANDVPRRVFGPGRVVLLRDGGGLVALDRANGRIAWEQPAAPDAALIVDSELLLAHGTVAGKPVLAAFAWANGATAFRVELPAAPHLVVPGPRGVAVVFPDRLVVHDRGGPRLFDVRAAVHDLVAGPDGWFTLTGNTVQAWTSAGEPRWSAKVPAQTYEAVELVATTAGDLVVVKYMLMADSGFEARCLDGATGGLLWGRSEEGLQIEHSKYWHRVHARSSGDALYFVSQAAGGNFVVELDAATGERRRREVFGKP